MLAFALPLIFALQDRAVTLPPDKQPVLALLRSLPMVGRPSYSLWTSIQWKPTGGSDSATYPCWHYEVQMTVQKVARFLKSSLSAGDGWTLTFPDARSLRLSALHKTKGRPDWHISTMDHGKPVGKTNEYDETSLTIWDESTVLSHSHNNAVPPSISDTPSDRLEAKIWEQYGLSKPGVRLTSPGDFARKLKFRYLLPRRLQTRYHLSRVALFSFDPSKGKGELGLAAAYATASGSYIVVLEARARSTSGSAASRDMEAMGMFALLGTGRAFQNCAGLRTINVLILSKPLNPELMVKVEQELRVLDRE